MEIDKFDAAKKAAIIASVVGVTVAAPYLAIYITPFLAPLLKDIAKAGVATIGGVGSNALWDLKDSFQPSHENEDLTRLLGRAYSAAIAEILEQAETDQKYEKFKDLIKFVLPTIKEDIDNHLATGSQIDLIKLFPTEENLIQIEVDGEKKLPFYKLFFGKTPIEYHAAGDDLLANVTSEEFILKLSDDRETAKKLVAEEVEITLRRWFVQLNPALAVDYSFPPSLDKFVFEKIGELIPQKINRLVKQPDLNLSWVAFQRSHLQAILGQVNNLQNALSDGDRNLLRPLGEALEKLSENNELISKLANGTETILGRVGESEENIKNCIAEESRKLQVWLAPKLDKILSIGDENLEISKRIETAVSNLTPQTPQKIKFKSQFPPNLTDAVYGRDDEIIRIIERLKNSKKHLIIAAFTCLGKTSLMRKLLAENYDLENHVSKQPAAFSDVLYIDCRQTTTFAEILRRFEALIQTAFSYADENRREFLKDKVFSQLDERKLLLILDNFETWQADGKYLSAEIRDFMEPLLADPNGIKAVFLSWHLPHKESEFNTKVENLRLITETLEKGLSPDAAFELVETEGRQYCKPDSLVDLDSIAKGDLQKFFERVSYVPQSIQSMVHFIGRKQCSFADFLVKYQEAFDAEELDETDLNEKRDKILRPAKALIKLQISLLNENAKELLRHLAFYGVDVPQDILILDLENIANEAETNRDELNRLVNDRLIIETVNRSERPPFALYNLHDYVRQAVRADLNDFQKHHQVHLEDLADRMLDKTNNAFHNKFFYKQLAFAECWKQLEDHLIGVAGKTARQFQRDSVDFASALASQEIAEAFAINLTIAQRKELRAKSEELYLEFIQKYPNYANAYCNLGGLLAEDKSRRQEAETNFKKAIELNPNDASAYNNLGVLFTEDENWREEAEANFKKTIELNPNYANAYNNLGVLLAKDESRREESEANYKKAIELNPNDASAYNNLGALLAEDENRREEAEAKYRKAIKLNPNYANAYINLGIVLAKDENRREEAEASYRKAIELNPNDADPYYNLGVLLAKDEDRREEAEASYRKAIELNPNYPSVYNNLGVLLTKDENRCEETETNYRKAIELNPNYASAYNNLGALLAEDENRREEAETNYRKAIELNPNYPSVYNNLGVLLAKDENRREEAEANYKKAIELNPNYASAYYNLGNLLARQEKELDEAESCFRNAIRLNPEFTDAYESLAVLKALYGNENNKDEIFDLLRKIIELDESQIELVKQFAEVDFIREDERFKEIIGE